MRIVDLQGEPFAVPGEGVPVEIKGAAPAFYVAGADGQEIAVQDADGDEIVFLTRADAVAFCARLARHDGRLALRLVQ